MSGPQFIHLDAYARETSKQNKTKTNIRGVIGEALREAGYTSHIKEPNAPTCIYGSLADLKSAEEEIYSKANSEKDPLGRKLRADANLLVAGVASYPKPHVAQKTADDKQSYILWRELTLDFLKAEFGNSLRAVLEHTDEEYPHLHFYIADRNQVRDTMKLHPGFKAKMECQDQKSKIAKDEAYREAMQSWQNKFFEAVGSDIGLTRLGPKVQRLNRQEWKARKQDAMALASIKHSIDAAWENLEIQLEGLEQEKQSIDKKLKQAIKDAMAQIREKYDEGIQKLSSTLDDLRKYKEKVALQYPEKAELIKAKGFPEMRAENLVGQYREAKDEQRSKQARNGTALKPPSPKPAWVK